MSGRGGTRRKGGGQGGASVRQKKAHKKERQLGRDEYLIVSHDSSDATKASAVSRGIISYLFGLAFLGMHRLPKNHLEVIESAFDNSLVKGAKRTFNCGELARAYRIALDKLLQAQGQESAGDEEGSEGKQGIVPGRGDAIVGAAVFFPWAKKTLVELGHDPSAFVEHAITVNAGMVALHFWESHCSASPSTTTMKGGSRFDDVEDGDGVGGEGGDDDGGSGDDEAGHGHHDEKEEQEGAGWEGDKPSASGKSKAVESAATTNTTTTTTATTTTGAPATTGGNSGNGERSDSRGGGEDSSSMGGDSNQADFKGDRVDGSSSQAASLLPAGQEPKVDDHTASHLDTDGAESGATTKPSPTNSSTPSTGLPPQPKPLEQERGGGDPETQEEGPPKDAASDGGDSDCDYSTASSRRYSKKPRTVLSTVTPPPNPQQHDAASSAKAQDVAGADPVPAAITTLAAALASTGGEALAPPPVSSSLAGPLDQPHTTGLHPPMPQQPIVASKEVVVTEEEVQKSGQEEQLEEEEEEEEEGSRTRRYRKLPPTMLTLVKLLDQALARIQASLDQEPILLSQLAKAMSRIHHKKRIRKMLRKIFLIDFDETLSPSFIEDWEKALEDLTEKQRALLKRLDKAGVALLQLAEEHGRFYITTNATLFSVMELCEKYLPGVYALLKPGGVWHDRIVSGRELMREAMGSEGLSSVMKILAYADATAMADSFVKGECFNHVICIGDDWRDVLGGLLVGQGLYKQTTVIKLAEDESLWLMAGQLEAVVEDLASLIDHDQPFMAHMIQCTRPPEGGPRVVQYSWESDDDSSNSSSSDSDTDAEQEGGDQGGEDEGGAARSHHGGGGDETGEDGR